MSATIVLDESLEKKTIDKFTELQSQSDLDINLPANYFSEFEHTTNLIDRTDNAYRTNNNFVNAFLDAYNYHKTLKIRPDDIKQQLLSIIAICVNNNAEKFRDWFVDHSDKKELVVISNHFSGEYFSQKFAELLRENIKNPEFADKYTEKFSTTTALISTVNNITLMNTLKEYFSYTMVLECGIPAVELAGTKEDWAKLKSIYEYFKNLFGETELKDWFRHFDKVLNLFIEMRNLQKDTEPEQKQPDGFLSQMTRNLSNLISNLTNYNITSNSTFNSDQESNPSVINISNNSDDNIVAIREMWKRVISYIPQGSGGDQILGGWVRLFVPYDSQNKIIVGLDKDIPCLDLSHSEPSKKEYYSWQDSMKKFYLGGGWGDMTSSCLTTPAKLIYYDGTEYSVEFYSGFFNPHFDANSDCVEMNFGYILRQDSDLKKKNLKEHYKTFGVKFYKSYGIDRMSVPYSIKKLAEKISTELYINHWEYHGKDEEKQKYIDAGVSIEENMKLNKFGVKKLKIPESLKDSTEDIKELFRVYRVEYF